MQLQVKELRRENYEQCSPVAHLISPRWQSITMLPDENLLISNACQDLQNQKVFKSVSFLPIQDAFTPS